MNIEIERKWTINGPILPNSAFDLLSITPKNHVAALSWTALSEADTTVSAAINLMLSNNVEKGLNALEEFLAPSLNFLLVDGAKMALNRNPSIKLDEFSNNSISVDNIKIKNKLKNISNLIKQIKNLK